jgi:perosamine synthetase
LFNAPQPRSRLYTTAAAYEKGAMAVLVGPDHGGSAIDRFEKALEELHPGCRAVAMPMARVGIYLALKNLIRPGQRVIMSPYTISDVVNMVLCAGGVPEFVDIEEGTCNIDAEALIERLRSADNVGAVLVTHFYGLICDILPIIDACKARGIPVIEDAAQAFGALLDGTRAGAMADVGVFSFGLFKHVTGFFGGAVLTKDAELDAKIRADLAEFGDLSRDMLLKKMASGAMFDIATTPVAFDTSVYWLFRYAYLHNLSFFNNKLETDGHPVAYSTFPAKYAVHMSSAQADIICPQFDRYEAATAVRIKNAQIYHEGLNDLPGVVLPPARTDGSHIYIYYAILCEEREKLARSMTRDLRDVQVSHHRNCAALPCFEEYARDCPNAERTAESVVYLPCYAGYREDQIHANIEAIRAYCRGSNL